MKELQSARDRNFCDSCVQVRVSVDDTHAIREMSSVSYKCYIDQNRQIANQLLLFFTFISVGLWETA